MRCSTVFSPAFVRQCRYGTRHGRQEALESGHAQQGDNPRRESAGNVHVEGSEPGHPPVLRRKHLHDIRGTFATRLMTMTDLTDEEIAGIMGWSPDEVKRIRAIYVDDTARTMAIGHRIARGL